MDHPQKISAQNSKFEKKRWLRHLVANKDIKFTPCGKFSNGHRCQKHQRYLRSFFLTVSVMFSSIVADFDLVRIMVYNAWVFDVVKFCITARIDAFTLWFTEPPLEWVQRVHLHPWIFSNVSMHCFHPDTRTWISNSLRILEVATFSFKVRKVLFIEQI